MKLSYDQLRALAASWADAKVYGAGDDYSAGYADGAENRLQSCADELKELLDTLEKEACI